MTRMWVCKNALLKAFNVLRRHQATHHMILFALVECRLYTLLSVCVGGTRECQTQWVFEGDLQYPILMEFKTEPLLNKYSKGLH